MAPLELLVRKVLLSAWVAVALTAAPPLYTRSIAIFGDSISDQDNFYQLTQRTLPRPPYWKGRFTNAPGNWVDQLKTAVKTNYISANYAYGGAFACGTRNSSVQIPGVLDQIKSFQAQLASNGTFQGMLKGKRRANIIWAGHNDITSLISADASGAPAILAGIVGCLSTAVQNLVAGGETTVFLMNLAPMELTPLVRVEAPAMAPLLKFAVDSINSGLVQAVSQLSQAYPHAKIKLLDANTQMAFLQANYEALGFTNTNGCLEYAPGTGILDGSSPISECPSSEGYVYFDDLHVAAASHSFIAGYIQDELKAAEFFI